MPEYCSNGHGHVHKSDVQKLQYVVEVPANEYWVSHYRSGTILAFFSAIHVRVSSSIPNLTPTILSDILFSNSVTSVALKGQD